MDKPLLIYDGHRGFCKLWIDYFKRRTGDRIAYAPSQEAAARYPQISADQFSSALQLVFPDVTYVSGAEAVFRTLGIPWVPGIRAVPDSAYRMVARYRSFFYQVTKLTFGTDIRPASFQRTEAVFLQVLGLIYFFAFVSIGSQVLVLFGRNGILPAASFLGGPANYRDVPTIFWLNASDTMLQAGWAALAPESAPTMDWNTKDRTSATGPYGILNSVLITFTFFRACSLNGLLMALHCWLNLMASLICT